MAAIAIVLAIVLAVVLFVIALGWLTLVSK
jgi:hypothetical protein